MKRWIALLMSLMLALPVMAAAESLTPVEGNRRLTVQFETETEGLTRVLQVAGLGSADQTESLAGMLAGLLNALEVQVDVSGKGMETPGDTAALRLMLEGAELIDLSCLRQADNRMLVITSLMPGIGMAFTEEAEEQTAAPSFEWEGQLEAFRDVFTSWLAGSDLKTETGVYTGDAYGLGDTRLTYTLSDRDMALLIQMLTSAASPMADAGILPQNVLNRLRETALEMGAQNRFRYVFRTVRSGDAPVGLSLTVWEGESQIATVSLGLGEKELSVVAGWGTASGAHYLDATFSLTQLETGFTGDLSARVLNDPAGLGFVAVRESAPSLREHMTVQFDGQTGDAWTLAINEQMEADEIAVETALKLDSELNGTYTVTLDGGAIPVAAVTLSGAEGAAATVDATGLTILDADDMSAAMENEAALEALRTGIATLMARLLKYLPADVLRHYMQLLP